MAQVHRKIQPNTYVLIKPENVSGRLPPGPAIYYPSPAPPAPPAPTLRFIFLPLDATSGLTSSVVAWCNDGTRMLVTDYDTNIYASTDGYAWTQLGTIGTSGDVLALAYGSGTYVAVGTAGVVYTSTDAVAWTPDTTGVSADLTCLTFGNGLFVAASSSDGTTVSSSNAGASWAAGSTGLGDFGSNIAYGNSLFLGISGTQVVYSSNGVSWSSTVTGATYTCAAYSPTLNLFALIGPGDAATTVDGTSLNESFPVHALAITGIAWGTGVFAACSGYGYVYTSTDGGNWTLAGADPNPSLNAEQGILAGLTGIFLVNESSPPT